MDARAKQRLTGAVILVALFVLLVPELLTGPRDAKAPAQAQEEEGLRRHVIELDQPAGNPPAAPAPAPSVVELPAPASAPQSASASGSAVPGEQATAAPAEEPVPARPATNPVVSGTPPATQAPATQPAPARTQPAAATGGRFAVQLGSFRDRGNADRLVRDMKARGFSAFIAPITSGGRELYRVRVGPSRDRPAAEELAADLRKMGQTGSIVPVP
jgi:DedD protein